MIFYFAGSLAAEELLPLDEDKKAGVLLTYYYRPQSRFRGLKKRVRKINSKKINSKKKE